MNKSNKEYKLHNLMIDNYKIAEEEIDLLKEKFRKVHLRSNITVTFVVLFFEALYFIVINSLTEDAISASTVRFLIKYAAIPFFLNVLLYLIVKHITTKIENSLRKNYIVMLSSIFQAFIYATVHQLFAVINAAFVVIILLSTIYQDKKLTKIVTLFSYIAMLFSAFVIKYDSDHIITNGYVLNFFVLVLIIIVAYVIAEYIIVVNEQFMKKMLNTIHEKDEYWYGMMADDLSGLYSKSALRVYFDKIKSCYDEMCLVMLDLDNFKKINDTFGHQYGDNVIKTLGRIIKDYISNDFIGFRYGGEEFLCLVKRDEARTYEIMNKIKEAFSRCCMEELGNSDIAFSAGISKLKKDNPIAECIKEADSALYKAKENGKNQIVVY